MPDLRELGEKLEQRKHNYQMAFESDAGHWVMGDLYHICCAGRSTFGAGDTRDTMLINEGKRQVWLHIISVLNISDADLHRLAIQHTQETSP